MYENFGMKTLENPSTLRFNGSMLRFNHHKPSHLKPSRLKSSALDELHGTDGTKEEDRGNLKMRIQVSYHGFFCCNLHGFCIAFRRLVASWAWFRKENDHKRTSAFRLRLSQNFAGCSISTTFPRGKLIFLKAYLRMTKHPVIDHQKWCS